MKVVMSQDAMVAFVFSDQQWIIVSAGWTEDEKGWSVGIGPCRVAFVTDKQDAKDAVLRIAQHMGNEILDMR